MTWMLTGGAGYIGAHIVRAFQAAGLPVVVLDDLSTGIRENVPADVPFVQASMPTPTPCGPRCASTRSPASCTSRPRRRSASRSSSRCSTGTRTSAGCVAAAVLPDEGVDRVLFSSSAAVYGEPPVELVTEETPPPRSARTARRSWPASGCCADRCADPSLRWAALRYFNVAGAGAPELADRSVNNLVPMVPGALRRPQPAAVR